MCCIAVTFEFLAKLSESRDSNFDVYILNEKSKKKLFLFSSVTQRIVPWSKEKDFCSLIYVTGLVEKF